MSTNLIVLPVARVPDALEQSLDPGQTEWERSRERDEFTRASILYRPSSSSLSSRFTRAQHGEDEDRVERSEDKEVRHPRTRTSFRLLSLVCRLVWGRDHNTSGAGEAGTLLPVVVDITLVK